MADSKITALTSISTSTDPANDPLVIVDVSDTSMAATGTTKKVTLNQLLGASGTATLASATISGALTVGTGANAAVLKASFLGGYSVFENSAGTGNPSITFNNDLDTGIRAPSANTLVFDAGGFEQYRIASSGVFTWSDGAGGTRMTLNSTGLGVGASPVVPLHIYSGGTGTTDFGNVVGTFRTGASGRAVALQFSDTANFANIGMLSGALQFAAGGSTTHMTISTSGNVGIGVTPSGSGGCLQLKSGITFPATQVASSDANTLDDYEEGTWTIVVNNQLGNSATIASQIARYVKIGRRVFVFGDFTLSAKGAAAAGNIVYLGNLPFVPNSTLFEGSVVHKYDNVNLTTNGQINIISAAGGNNVCFFPISSATTGTSNLTFGQITDTTRLVFNFSYDV